jgi:hypothetical protein
MHVSDLAIGLFPNFKFDATVLVRCTEPGISALRQLVSASAQSPVAIHEHASVAPKHRVELWAAPNAVSFGLTWVSPLDSGADEQLASLCANGAGHQYFELSRFDVALMVSLNEYDDEWWVAHA